MLTEPPGVALVRTSTYTLRSDRPGWIDLTTVHKQPLMEQPDLIATADWSEAPSGQVPSRPLHTKATYEILGDRLTYCVAPPGHARPTELTTMKGDGYTLVSLRRQGTMAYNQAH